MMKLQEFIDKLYLALNSQTLYASGAFGAPLTERSKNRYHVYAPVNPNCFLFDCVCLIKGILWGWNANSNAIYGGAEYRSNGVPDVGEDRMISMCTNVSSDFSKISAGEAVWMQGHIGVYVGDGYVIECTTDGTHNVQKTTIPRNIGVRTWTKHGFLPWVDYADVKPEPKKNTVEYAVYEKSKKEWLPPVTGYDINDYNNGYAGNDKGGITGAMVMFTESPVEYTVSTIDNGWLSPVTGYNKGDKKNGYAGNYNLNNSSFVDRFMIKVKSDKYKVVYRAKIRKSDNKIEWLPEVTGYDKNNKKNGYAGITGKAIIDIAIKIVKNEDIKAEDPKKDNKTNDSSNTDIPVQDNPDPITEDSVVDDPSPVTEDPIEIPVNQDNNHDKETFIERIIKFIKSIFKKLFKRS